MWQIEMWHNSKTPILTKVKKSNCNKKTQTVKNLKNANFDDILRIYLWQNLKTQIVTKHKSWIFNYTQKLKLWQNLKKNVLPKFQNFSSDKS